MYLQVINVTLLDYLLLYLLLFIVVFIVTILRGSDTKCSNDNIYSLGLSKKFNSDIYKQW